MVVRTIDERTAVALRGAHPKGLDDVTIFMHHASYIIHHTSYIIHHHTSYIIYIHTSYIIHIIHHTSYIIHHTSYIIQYMHTHTNIKMYIWCMCVWLCVYTEVDNCCIDMILLRTTQKRICMELKCIAHVWYTELQTKRMYVYVCVCMCVCEWEHQKMYDDRSAEWQLETWGRCHHW